MTATITDQLAVYVPAPGTSGLQAVIAPGSGIVSKITDADHVLVHYEGNVYGAVNIVTYADKCWHAADRLITNYPTSSFWAPPRTELVEIGLFLLPQRRVLLHGPEAADTLAAWLGLPVDELAAQLEVTS